MFSGDRHPLTAILESVMFVEPGFMPVDERFKKGLALFNRQEFFECHEVIEDLWLRTSETDPNRDLYKGVIQAAAAIYQFDRGILSGAVGLFRTAMGNLEKYRPQALGLNVEKLSQELKVCFAPLENWDGRRKITLKKDLLPKLEYSDR